MIYLLDTHVFVWWLNDDAHLPARVRSAIADDSALVFVSVATIWEIAIKAQLGKIDVDRADLTAEIPANDFLELPIRSRHAALAGALPPHHQDPFDRMLIAQARLEGLTLVSHDTVFDRYDVATLKA